MVDAGTTCGRARSLWNRVRPVLALAAICAIAELAYAVVNILAIPVYVSKELGLGAFVGVVMGAFLLAEAVGRLGLGALSDYIGRRPLIVLGPLVSGAASLAVIHVGSPAALVLVRVFDGLGAAAFWPALFAAAGDTTSEEDRGTGMSVLNVAYMVGLAFGPLAGGWINAEFGAPSRPVYHAAFYLSAGLFAAAALIGLLFAPRQAYSGLAHDAGGEGIAGGERFAGAGSMARAAARTWRLLLLAFVTFLAIGLLIPVVELYALDRYGIDQKTFGSLFVAPAAVIALAAVPMGRLSDRWGRVSSIRAGMLLGALSLWAVPFVGSCTVLSAGAILVGMGFLLAFPAWMALLTEITDAQSRGAVLGAAGMAQGFGAISGTVAGGKLYHGAGFLPGVSAHDSPIFLAAGLLTLSFLLAALLLRAGRGRDGPKKHGPRKARVEQAAAPQRQ